MPEDHASILTMPISGKPNAVLLTNAMRDEDVKDRNMSYPPLVGSISTRNGVPNISGKRGFLSSPYATADKDFSRRMCEVGDRGSVG